MEKRPVASKLRFQFSTRTLTASVSCAVVTASIARSLARSVLPQPIHASLNACVKHSTADFIQGKRRLSLFHLTEHSQLAVPRLGWSLLPVLDNDDGACG